MFKCTEEITPPSSPAPTTTCNCPCSKELKKIREQLANMAQVQSKIYLELKNLKKTTVVRPDTSELASLELRSNFPLKTIEEVQKMETALFDKQVFQEIVHTFDYMFICSIWLNLFSTFSFNSS